LTPKISITPFELAVELTITQVAIYSMTSSTYIPNGAFWLSDILLRTFSMLFSLPAVDFAFFIRILLVDMGPYPAIMIYSKVKTQIHTSAVIQAAIGGIAL
jgi:hypothetical protein